jgi:hypothetical protein
LFTVPRSCFGSRHSPIWRFGNSRRSNAQKVTYCQNTLVK